MWRHYVYLHRKASDGHPFYVGKGSVRARKKSVDYERANTRFRRSIAWARTAEKHGLIVEIVAMFITDADSQAFEVALIAQIGRRDLKRGPLVNVTDGGDGHAGIIASKELRAIRSRNNRGTRSAAWVASIRRARKNGGNGGVVKTGDKLPESWKRNIAKTKTGALNPMFGKTGDAHPNSRFVVDAATGHRYPSLTAAANAEGFAVQNMHDMLTNPRRRNVTTLRLIG